MKLFSLFIFGSLLISGSTIDLVDRLGDEVGLQDAEDAIFDNIFHKDSEPGTQIDVDIYYEGHTGPNQVGASLKMNEEIEFYEASVYGLVDGADGLYDCDNDDQGPSAYQANGESHRSLSTTLWKSYVDYISLFQHYNFYHDTNGYTKVKSFKFDLGDELSEGEFGIRIGLPLLELCEIPGLDIDITDAENNYLRWYEDQVIHFKWNNGVASTTCERTFKKIGSGNIDVEEEKDCIQRLCDSIFFTQGHEKSIKYSKGCGDIGLDLEKARVAKLSGKHELEFITCKDVRNAKSNPEEPFEAVIGYGNSEWPFLGLDNPDKDDHVPGKKDVYFLDTGRNGVDNGFDGEEVDFLRLDAYDSDGWCISSVKLDGKILLDESKKEGRFWLDSPCTKPTYSGIPCFESYKFRVYEIGHSNH